MALDADDRRLLHYLTAKRDDDVIRDQGRSARRKFNAGIGNNPYTPIVQRGERTYRDRTGDQAARNADRRSR
jgi:hypothetical protein